MPAFSHCFLKRFMAFSNDSPSLTRTPGILGITTLRGVHQSPGFWRRGSIRVGRGVSNCEAQRPAERQIGSSFALFALSRIDDYAVPVSDFAGTATGSPDL